MTLADGLLQSAVKFGRSALKAYLNNEWDVFFLHAATSLEHLLKAFLARSHPSLVSARDFDSLLHANDMSQHAKRRRMLTVTMTETLERAGRLIPPIANLRLELELLTEVRNGVAHLAQIDTSAVSRTRTAWLRATRHVLEALEGAEETFWGVELQDVVAAHLSEQAQEAERLVAERIAIARLTFDQRFGHLDAIARRVILGGIEAGYVVGGYTELLVECPVCSTKCLIEGSNEVEWEADYDVADGEAYIAGAYPVVTFFPYRLECQACGLALDGEDEVVAAGFERSWELEDVDPADFHEEPYDPYE